MAKKKKEAQGLQETLEKLNKQYGVGTVLSLEDKSTDGYELISSGSIAIDYITLGIGGFAKGKLYEIIGWEGSNKTTICGHVAAECQKQGGTVLYIDGEHAVDKNYFKAIGVDTSKLLLAQPSNGEEGFNIAAEMIKTGEIDLVIIDSDSSLIPKAVVDGEIGDSAIGKKARLNGSAYPKLKAELAKHNVCGIVISQWREKIGVMFGDSRTTQGGHALKFYSDVRIEMSKINEKEGDVVVGNRAKAKCIKNKMAPPFRVGQVSVIFGVGIDKVGEIFDLGKEFEIFKKWGETITYGEIKYSEQEFREKLLEEDFYNEIKEQIIPAIKAAQVEDEQAPTEE